MCESCSMGESKLLAQIFAARHGKMSMSMAGGGEIESLMGKNLFEK